MPYANSGAGGAREAEQVISKGCPWRPPGTREGFGHGCREVSQNHHTLSGLPGYGTPGPMSRQGWNAGSLVGVGLAGLVALVALWSTPAPAPVPSDGELGTIRLYGQTEAGPVGLIPNRPEFDLTRPQTLVFQFFSKGSGPREVRIELETDQGTSVLYDEILTAPFQDTIHMERFGEADPDHLKFLVAIEASHMPVLHTEYLIRLVGADTRKSGP